MFVTLENLTKRFGGVIAVDEINLDIQDGEFIAFLGPSGCGKTTTLLMIAGIYRPTTGEIRFGDRVMNRVAPKDRNVGMVFQSYALYPHMTVFENLAFPMKLKKVPTAEIDARAQQVADMMGIGHLMDRRPGQLSGGQQQRVALGRALVKQPDVLLFDEPLSNLDARLRLTMRAEIKRLQLDLGITSIYVTHDQVEALTLADRIAVMKEGRLQAFDPPQDLYERPRTLFVAGFVGNPPMNFVDVDVVRQNGRFVARNQDLSVALAPRHEDRPVGQGRIMGVRPEHVTVQPGAEGEGLVGEVFIVEPLGRENLVEVQIGDVRLSALADPDLRLHIGDTVRLRIDSEKLQFFDPNTERSLLW